MSGAPRIPDIFGHLGLHETDFIPVPADPASASNEALTIAAADLMANLGAVKAELDRRGVAIAGLIPEYLVACVEKAATKMPEGDGQ